MSYFVKSNFIFDVNKKNTFSGVLEIENGIIKNIFTNNFCSENKKVIDYKDKMIIPGFIDSHVHFYLSTLINTKKISFINGKTIKEVVKKAEKIPKYEGWKIGIGWYASDFGNQVFPNCIDLDEFTKDTPTMLISGDIHTIWLNTKAMEVLNIKENNIPNYLNNHNLEKTEIHKGLFFESVAIYYLAKVLEIYKTKFPKIASEYMKNLNSMGITAIGDVSLTANNEDDLVYPNLYEKIKEPTVKISFFPTMKENTTNLLKLYKKYRFDFLQMGGVKQFFDGVTSSHTALLKEEYNNPHYKGDVGMSLLPLKEIKKLIHLANKNRLPIRIHAIGDKAIELTLKYLKEAQEKYPLNSNQNNTIEHLEVMDLKDLHLVKQKNLVISVQPSHLIVGYETIDDEVGENRAKNMFPFNSFVKANSNIAFGTDSPVVINVSSIESIYYAVERKTKEGNPKESLMPNQKMSIVDSLYAHTKGAALSLSRNDIGSIEIGKKADFVILNKNILKTDNVLEIKILETYISGKKVYENKN